MLLALCGCKPGLVFNVSPEMSPEQMLHRASLVFIGVIEEHHIEWWPLFRLTVPGEDPSGARYWKILRREVRVETVIRGVESRKRIDIYEIFWTGGASGNWNFTQNSERDLFLVRIENGRYHVVRDWVRSIFPVTSGPHQRLPLDDSHSLWERIALMNWWIPQNDPAAKITYPYFLYNDPGRTLSLWRVVKLERGLVRHPSPAVRIPACRELLLLGGWLQDECWERLSDSERAHLSDGGFRCCSAAEIATTRLKTRDRGALSWWRVDGDPESRRLLTAVSDPNLRAEFCRLWEREYPDDRDHGCPPDRPPPATIVTEKGDVPLAGPWPHS